MRKPVKKAARKAATKKAKPVRKGVSVKVSRKSVRLSSRRSKVDLRSVAKEVVRAARAGQQVFDALKDDPHGIEKFREAHSGLCQYVGEIAPPVGGKLTLEYVFGVMEVHFLSIHRKLHMIGEAIPEVKAILEEEERRKPYYRPAEDAPEAVFHEIAPAEGNSEPSTRSNRDPFAE